eukprot:scaffold37536_cov34-Phaeocystis_antarctica.AAC.1
MRNTPNLAGASVVEPCARCDQAHAQKDCPHFKQARGRHADQQPMPKSMQPKPGRTPAPLRVPGREAGPCAAPVRDVPCCCDRMDDGSPNDTHRHSRAGRMGAVGDRWPRAIR